MEQERPHEFGIPESEEAGFVRAAQRGDRVAFIALARGYWPSVSRVVGALTGSEGPAARRTLDVFEHAWKGLHFMPEGLRFYVWIHRIAFNRCQAGPTLSETSVSETAGEDAAQRCARAFAQLSPEHQQVLALRLASHIEVESIARILELSTAAAQARLSEARADLHGRWNGADPTTSLRHFTLQQLSDYVGTDPAAAPEFVRAHLGECGECRRILTALEAQERMVTLLLADAADAAGLEPFLNQLVERIAGERHADRMTASPRPAPPQDRASGIPIASIARAPQEPRRDVAPATEPGAVSGTSATRPFLGRALIGVALVLAALLGIQFGPRLEPWLESQGIRWGNPLRPAPPTRAASVKRYTAPPEPGSLPTAPGIDAVEPPVPEEPEAAPVPASPAPAATRKSAAATPERHPARPPADGGTTRTAATRTAANASPSNATPGATTAAPPPSTSTSAAQTPATTTAETTPAPETHRDTAAAPPAVPPRPPGPRLVCGRVSDVNGRPVEGAQVNLTGIDLVALTDRQGRFCVSVPAGNRTLSVLATGFRPLYRAIGEATTDADLALTMEAGPPPRRP